MGGRDNPVCLLDTERGIVLWPECPQEVSDQAAENLVGDDPFHYAAENEAEWRSGCVLDDSRLLRGAQRPILKASFYSDEFDKSERYIRDARY